MSPAHAAAGIYQEGSCTPSETTVLSSVDDAVGGSRFAYDVTARLRSTPLTRTSRTRGVVLDGVGPRLIVTWVLLSRPRRGWTAVRA